MKNRHLVNKNTCKAQGHPHNSCRDITLWTKGQPWRHPDTMDRRFSWTISFRKGVWVAVDNPQTWICAVFFVTASEEIVCGNPLNIKSVNYPELQGCFFWQEVSICLCGFGKKIFTMQIFTTSKTPFTQLKTEMARGRSKKKKGHTRQSAWLLPPLVRERICILKIVLKYFFKFRINRLSNRMIFLSIADAGNLSIRATSASFVCVNKHVPNHAR